jgi:hypothetical protein
MDLEENGLFPRSRSAFIKITGLYDFTSNDTLNQMAVMEALALSCSIREIQKKQRFVPNLRLEFIENFDEESKELTIASDLLLSNSLLMFSKRS